jgi:hypothetical protein
MSTVTLITDLPRTEEDSTKIIVQDQENLSELVVDLSTPLETRINGIEIFFDKFGQEESSEIINRLGSMYQFSGTKILEKYLYEICTNCKISSFLKIATAKSLCYFDKEKEIGYKALNIVCEDMKDVATPCKIDAICLLMVNKKYKQQSRDYFCAIINNRDLECDFRYKTILSLENKEIPNKSYFMYESVFEFFNNTFNRTLYRILAGQYIIQKCNPKKHEKDHVEVILLSFAQDPDLDYNLRADSADVILSLGSLENKETAREIIMILGRQDGAIKTIFDNAQNVHVDEIEQSVIEALEFLSGINMKTLSGVPGTPQINFEYVKKQIEDELEKFKPKEPEGYQELLDGQKKLTKTYIVVYEKEKEEYDEKKDKINVSLNRIYMDRALYSSYNCSLLHILLKVWTYLTTHKSEEDMKNRLIEELIEMSGTCSSGFASRLVNVISGFGDFNLTISWRDQIVANFTGRLNACARDITLPVDVKKNCEFYGINMFVCDCCSIERGLADDETHKKLWLGILENFQGLILEEMSLNCNDFNSRRNFLKFFRKNMLGIREELYEEFKAYIPDTDFDLYFRSAISSYETGYV